MGNCKKQNSKRPELNINELFKRIKFESKQIQNTFREIEGLLKRSKELMQQLLTAKNNGFLNGNTFFNVAEAPAAPIPTPATPAAPAPVTPLVQIITKDIARIVRQIRILKMELAEYIGLAIQAAQVLARAQTAAAAADQEVNEEIGIAALFTAVSGIENTRRQLQELRDELNADIVILLGIAGEL